MQSKQTSHRPTNNTDIKKEKTFKNKKIENYFNVNTINKTAIENLKKRISDPASKSKIKGKKSKTPPPFRRQTFSLNTTSNVSNESEKEKEKGIKNPKKIKYYYQSRRSN